MDTTRLGRGEQIAAGSAIALLIIAVLINWFSVGPFGFDAFESGGFFRDLVMLLAIAAGIGLAVLAATSQSVNLPVAPSAIVAGLGILNTLLILIWVLDPPEGASRSVGLFLGLIASAGIAYGGWQAMQEEGTSFGDQRDRFGDRDRGGPGAPPPGPGPGTGGEPPPPGPRA